MIKITFLYATGICLLAAGCQKTKDLKGFEKAFASVSLTNVNASAKSVDFIIDGAKKTINAPVAANATILGTYVGVNGDATHALTVRDAANTTLDYFVGTIKATPTNSYSLFVYDTLTGGKFKTLFLTANRMLSPGNLSTANVRFINFSPKSPVLDAWLVRVVGATRTDSLKIAPLATYVGSVTNLNVTALSTYTSVAANQAAGANGAGSAITSYVLKLTLANTNTIVVSAATTIIPGRNYTFYSRGIYPATAISLLTDN